MNSMWIGKWLNLSEEHKRIKTRQEKLQTLTWPGFVSLKQFFFKLLNTKSSSSAVVDGSIITYLSISLRQIVRKFLYEPSVHRMLRVLLLLLLLLLLCQVFTSSQSYICLAVRFGFVHCFICIC